jgi:endo-1,4-beta-xylanase
LFGGFRSVKDYIGSVTFWGIADDYTWLNYRSIKRTDAPFPFDNRHQLKPSFWGMADPSKLPQ